MRNCGDTHLHERNNVHEVRLQQQGALLEETRLLKLPDHTLLIDHLIFVLHSIQYRLVTNSKRFSHSISWGFFSSTAQFSSINPPPRLSLFAAGNRISINLDTVLLEVFHN